MKRAILILLVTIIAISSVLADSPVKLTLRASVPEDYGIIFPAGLRIDNLVLSLKGENEENFELLGDGSYYAGSISDYPDGLRFRLLYYGNSATPYDVVLSVEAMSGWRKEFGDNEEMPIYIYFEELISSPDGVFVSFIDDTNVRLVIDRIGPQRGLEVLDLVVSWDESLTAAQGEYAADLNFSVGVL